MQGIENSVVKHQLMIQFKELQSKQTMIPYYMSYDYPDKQRALKSWWEDLIENIIRKKNQIYITFKDLETITTINGLKPTPLKNVLQELKKYRILVKQEDITRQNKPKKEEKKWYTSIIAFAWSKTDSNDVEFPFKFEPQQKIISSQAKLGKKRELMNFFRKQFIHENSTFLNDFMKKISWAIKTDDASVQLLLKESQRQKQIILVSDQNSGDSILIYDQDRRKIQDENFIKIQKVKCLLRRSLQHLDHLFENSSTKIADMRQKVKGAIRINDKQKSQLFVANIVKQEKHRQQINTRKEVLERQIKDIEINDMNKSSIDLLQEAQKLYESVAVDSKKFDQVMQKGKEIQIESKQANERFKELVDSDQVENEVDQMMKELEKQEEIRKKKNIEPQTVKVDTLQNSQKQKMQQYEI